MEIIWTCEAEESLTEIAIYWADRNGSSDYSEKIISEVEKLLKDISSNPFYIRSIYSEIRFVYKVYFKREVHYLFLERR